MAEVEQKKTRTFPKFTNLSVDLVDLDQLLDMSYEQPTQLCRAWQRRQQLNWGLQREQH